MISWFGFLSRPQQIAVALGVVGAISLLDYETGIELSFSVFYFLPIIAVSWYSDQRSGIFIACVSASAWVAADYFGGHVYSLPYIFTFNAIVRLAIFLIIAILIAKLKTGSDLLKQTELSAQKSYDVITTSQKIIAILADSIIKRNAELWLWIVRQKEANKPVPKIIESTCEQIGANLSTLTEICYSYQPIEKEHINVDDLVSELEKKLLAVNTKYTSTELEAQSDIEKTPSPVEFLNDELVLQHDEFMRARKLMSEF